MAKHFTITASLRFSWMRWEISVSSGRTLMSSAYDISSTAGETVETIADQLKQIYHWVEHYLELYTTQIWCLRVLLLSSQTCQSWMSYIVVSRTMEERNSARLQVPRASQQRFWRRGNQPYYNNCVNYSPCSGKKTTCPDIRGTLRSSPCRRTKVIDVIATIIRGSFCSV